MLKRTPIGHLSGRGYAKKKRFQIITIAIVAIALLYLLFHFSGRNIKYALLIKSGATNLEKGKLTYALSDFNKALNMKADGALAIDGIGAVYLRQNDFEKAHKYYTEALAAKLKINKMINHVNLGNYYLDRGVYKNAEIEFKHAVQLNSVDSDALFGLGCCLHAGGNLDAAINYYNKSLTYNPKSTKARKNLSMAESDRNKGAMYYLFDRNGEPLARYNLIASGNRKTFIMDHKAAHITGYDRNDGEEKAGLEKYMEDYLPGNKIYLTIDSKVQQTAGRALGWYKGSIVILDPKTGEILGLYNQPTFRPNNVNSNKYWREKKKNRNKPFVNRAIEKLYEPGSIAKLITLAAAFEYGISEDEIFPIRCAGSTGLNGKTFWCWETHGRVKSIKKTMATSCNIGMAFIGFAVGSARLFEYNTKFGFGYNFDLGIKDTLRGTEISIPVAVGSAPTEIKDRYEMAKYACGLSPDDRKDTYMMTPLQAALLTATIANKGVMMNPYIIKEIRNINGKLIYKSEPREVKRPITPSTAEKLTELMINDVEDKGGTGVKARVKGISVAGKTGTSGADVNGTLNAWFISFAPADNPRYAIAIVGDGEGKGMQVAAPIAADIYKSLIKD